MNAELKKAILELASKNTGGISYAELMDIPGFAGEFNLVHPQFPLVLYWKGLSLEAAACVRELLSSGLAKHAPTDELSYIAFGKTLDLPIFTSEHAKQAASLATPHWMPVLLSSTAKSHSGGGSP
jgi:hypothetical protein